MSELSIRHERQGVEKEVHPPVPPFSEQLTSLIENSVLKHYYKNELLKILTLI